MKDRLGAHKWVNLPIVNPTQSTFVRFLRQPQAGLPDMLADHKRAWDDMMTKAIRPRIEEM